MSKTLTDEIYSGTASFGRIWAVVSAVLGTLMGIFFMVVGVYVIFHKSHLKSTDGDVVKDSECTTTTEDGKTYTHCSTTVDYKVNDQEYTNKQVDTGSTKFVQGTKNIEIWYSPAKPENPEYNPIPVSFGWVIIFISLLIVISSWFWVWLTRKYKMAAAFEGATGIYSILAGR